MKKKNRNSTKTQPFILQLPLFPRGVFQEKGRLFQWDIFRTKPTDIDIEIVIKNGESREWKSGRGPKYGSGRINPSFIVGGVDTLVEKGKVKNLHAAFPEIAEAAGYQKIDETHDLDGSDYVKKIYYKAIKRDEYRNLIEWNEPGCSDDLPNPEFPLINYIKDCLSRKPKDMKRKLRQIAKVYGREKVKEVLALYIGELEKLFTDAGTSLIIRKCFEETDYINKARALMTFLGDKNL
jgi:hypothetical protein